jgi:hypothetical protein
MDVMERGFAGLLQPLDRQQAAPILFLWIQKATSLLVPHSEMGFRIFPLVAWCLSLALFWGVLRKVLTSKLAIVLGLAVFVLDHSLLRYSNEGKQYIVDVLVALSMAFIVLSQPGAGRWAALAVAGVAGIVLSNVAPVVLLCCGAYLLYETVSNRGRDWFWLLGVAALWLVTFGLYYVLFIAHHPLQGYMVGYWDRQGKFMPWNPLTKAFWKFGKDAALMLFRDLLGFGPVAAGIFMILFLVGLVVSIVKRRFAVLALAALPILVHAVLSAFRLYPMADRMSLYLTPGLILVVALGAQFVLETALAVRHRRIAASGVFVGIAALLGVFLLNGYPYRGTEVRPVIDYLVKNAGNDAVFWYYGAPIARFYEAIGYPLPKNVVYGDITKPYLTELAPLHGRVWLVFAYGRPKTAEDDDLRALKSMGIAPSTDYRAEGARAYLVTLP